MAHVPPLMSTQIERLPAVITPREAVRTAGRSLIPLELYQRLAHRVTVEERMSAALAERIVDQALAFLGACAQPHCESLAPSDLVDLGWHAFVLHTKDYAEFCHRLAGRFLHHVPTEPSDPTAHGTTARATLARTVAAIDAAGFVVDAALWPAITDKCNVRCSQCKNGCADDPPPATIQGVVASVGDCQACRNGCTSEPPSVEP
jgi:hypothetical protein